MSPSITCGVMDAAIRKAYHALSIGPCSGAARHATIASRCGSQVCVFAEDMMTTTIQTIGEHIRDWRQRRRFSQLALACEAGISARHLSFIETGRAVPSRDMILLLAEQLNIPLRQRNRVLLAAGYAPHYAEHDLGDAPLRETGEAIGAILTAHEPFPAMAVDGHWNLVQANRSMLMLMTGVDPALLVPPVNVLRLALHPKGVAPRIRNFAQWRAHILHRLRHQHEYTADAFLLALHDELAGFPMPAGTQPIANVQPAIAVPLQFDTPCGMLSLLSMTMTFGTPLEVSLSELVLETFLPADAESAAMLRDMALADAQGA